MKYTYAYKTSDGVRHEAEIEAPSREVVFAELRKQGIKAIKVTAADGSKANGEIRGVRRRVVVIVSVSAALVAGFLAYFGGKSSIDESPTMPAAAAGGIRIASPLSRQPVLGDRQRVEAALNSITNTTDRFLAAFAEPGRQPVLPGDSARPSEKDFERDLRTPIRIADTELTESIDLKRITAGIKKEMLAYLNGGGKVDDYVAELKKRQNTEISYRDKANSRLKSMLGGDKAKAYEYFLKANAQLQSMGIYPLSLPDALRNYQLSLDFD